MIKLEAEIGPVKYIAALVIDWGITNEVDTGEAVRWGILIIICVLDPLAVLLLVAANQSLIRRFPVEPLPPPQEIGGCLIATAAFGSEMASQVQLLREIRDNTVLQTESGALFMTSFNQFYYSFSPVIADYERENYTFKEAVKLTLTPLLASLTILQYADIDSESEMLGYGIGIIILNIGVYFIAPAVLIMKIRKKSKYGKIS